MRTRTAEVEQGRPPGFRGRAAVARPRVNHGWCYVAAGLCSVALWYGLIELFLVLT